MFSWLRQRQARRDAEAFARLMGMRDRAANATTRIVFVQHVYQRAHRGTKAFVVCDDTHEQRDAWFWWFRAEPGQMAAVRALSGWGPHNRRDDVLYIGGEHTGSGVCELLPAKDVARAKRYYERMRMGPNKAEA